MVTPASKRDKDHLNIGERFGEVIALVMLGLLFAFLLHHQSTDTGFFTSDFGTTAQFYLYGPLLMSMTAPLTRAIVGRRNPARPLEIASNLFLAVAAIYLLREFPFNFMYIAEPLPEVFHSVVEGINSDIAHINDLARIPLILQIVVSPLIAMATAWQFVTFRLHRPVESPAQ